MATPQDIRAKILAARAAEQKAQAEAAKQQAVAQEPMGPPAPTPEQKSAGELPADRYGAQAHRAAPDIVPYEQRGGLDRFQQHFEMDPSGTAWSQPLKAATAFMVDNLPELTAAGAAIPTGAAVTALTGNPVAGAGAASMAAGPGSLVGSELQDKIMKTKTPTVEKAYRAAANMGAELLGQGIFLAASGVRYIKNEALPHYWQSFWKNSGGRPVREAAQVLQLARSIDDSMVTRLLSRGYTMEQVESARAVGATLSDLSEGKVIDWVENAARNSVFTKEDLNTLRSIHRDLIDLKAQDAVEKFGPLMHPDDIANELATRAHSVAGEAVDPGSHAYEIVEQRLATSTRVVMEKDPFVGAWHPKTEGAPMTPAKPAAQVGTREISPPQQRTDWQGRYDPPAPGVYEPDLRLGEGGDVYVPANAVTEPIVTATGSSAGLVNTKRLKFETKRGGGAIPSDIRARIAELPEKADFREVRSIVSDLKAHIRASRDSREPATNTLRRVGKRVVGAGKEGLIKAAQDADRAMAGDRTWMPLTPMLSEGELMYRDGKAMVDDAVMTKLLAYGTNRADAAKTGRALLTQLMEDGNDRAIHMAVRRLSRSPAGREAVQGWQRSVMEDIMAKARKSAGTVDPSKFLEAMGAELTDRGVLAGQTPRLIAKPEYIALFGRGRTEHLVKQLRRMATLTRRNPISGGTSAATVGDRGVLLGSAALAAQAAFGQGVRPQAIAGFAGYVISIRGVAKLLMNPDTTDLLFKTMSKPAFVPKAQGRWGQNPAAAALISRLLARLDFNDYEEVK